MTSSGKYGNNKSLKKCNMINFIEKTLVKRRLNLLYTLYLNLRLFSIKQAVKFPIYVYGWPKIYNTSGTAVCVGKVKTGMIKINPLVLGRMAPQSQPVELNIGGKIIFKGRCVIRAGSIISVRPKAQLSIGYDVRICEHCRICCCNTSIDIGDFASISHYVQILDSSFHYIADFNTNKIKNKSQPVKIGNYCWVCNSSSISPGTIIPDYTIIASNSIANKDYSDIPPMSLIGGVPAKIIKSNVKRVWYEAGKTSKFHRQLNSYFDTNEDMCFYGFDNSIKPKDLDINI